MNLHHNLRKNKKGIGTVFGMVFFLLIVMVVFASFVIVLNQNTGLEQATIQAKQLDLDRYSELETVSITNPQVAVLNSVVYISCTITNIGTLPTELVRLWIKDNTTNTVGNTIMAPSITLQPGSSIQYFNFTRVANAGLFDRFSFWFISTRGNSISAYPNTNQLSGIAPVGTFPGVADINSTYQTNVNNPMRLSLTTTKPNQLIYVVVSYDDGNTLYTPTSTPSLTWTLRGTSLATDQNSGDSILKTFYAIDPSVGPITINIQSTADELSDYYCSAMACAISDVNTTSPFDGSAQTTIGRSTMPQDTINTHYSNDFIIGALGIDDLNPAITPGAGFAQIMPVQSSYGASGEPNSMPRSVWSEWAIMGDPRNNLPVNCTFPFNEDWAIIVDAVKLVVIPPTAPMSLSPASGPIGQPVTVSGQGFAANSQLIATFDGSLVPFSFTTDGTGKIPAGATFTVPQGSTAGNKTVTIIDSKFNYASANFTVTASTITVNPTTGPVRTTVTVTGSNFIDNSTITLKLNGTPIATNPSTVIADATGHLSATFNASGTAGINQVLASDGINSAYANFTVTPSITITPNTGLSGVQATISGQGFAANSNLIVTFAGIVVSPPPANAVTDATGTFSNLVFAPQSSTPGVKLVNVTDSSGNYNSTVFNLMLIPNVPAPTLTPVGPIVLGTSVSGSVPITGVSGFPPTGTVTFQVSIDGGSTWNAFGTMKTLVSGSATSDSYTPQTVGGVYQFRTIYNGDSNYVASTGAASGILTVNKGTASVGASSFVPPSPVTLGSSVTVSASVSPPSGIATVPTGSVQFQVRIGASSYANFGSPVTLSGSSASVSYTPSTATTYNFQAVYLGDSNYNSGTTGAASGILTVNKGTASVGASSFVPPSPVTLGSSVTVSASVSPPSGIATVPTGNVQFMVKVGAGSYTNFGSPIALSGSSASITYTPSAIGTYSFQATYQGDSNYVSGTIGAASGTLTVYIPSSTTTVLSVSSPITLGGTTTDSATVTPQTYLYNQVTFVGAGTGVYGTGTSLSVAYPAGWAANDLLLLQVTVRSTSAEAPSQPSGWNLLFGPDSSGTGRQWIYSRFATGSDSSPLSVNFASGSTYLKLARIYEFHNVAASSFTESASFGSNTGSNTISAQPVTTADVNRLAVSFVFDTYSNSLGSFSGASGGSWNEPVSELTRDGGSTNTRGGIQLQTVTIPSAGTISGGSLTISTSASWGVRAFALIPSAALATGNINFQVLAPGGSWTTYSTQTLASGGATSAIYTPMSVGTWYFRAVYAGDSNYAGSQSVDDVESLIVNAATATVGASTFAPASPIGLGTIETVSVTVAGPSGVTAPTGNVQFQVSINGGAYTNFGSLSALSGGSASISYTPSSVDTFSFQAIYQGDSNYNSGTAGAPSGTLTVKYSPNVPVPTLNPVSPITLGGSVAASVTVTGSAGTPTGTITFQYSTDSGTNWNTLGAVKTLVSGSATSDSYTPLSATNNYRFRAIYSGDGNYIGVTGAAASLTVNNPFGLDGKTSGSVGGTSLTLTLPTTYTNDVVYVSVVTYGGYSATVSGSGLSWSRQAFVTYSSTTIREETWYAVQPASGSTTINIAVSGSAYTAAVAFGVSGANTTSPFDVPSVTNTGSSNTASASITTTNANDLIVGSVGIDGTGTVNVGSGYTLILTQASSSSRETSAEYKTVISAGSNTVNFSIPSNNWAIIVDAIKRAS